MQLTNNRTTVEIDENRLLNLIIDQRIVQLEKIIAAKHNCIFKDVPTKAFHSHLYLCLVELDLKASEIADVYDVKPTVLDEILKGCHTKMLINKQYELYLYGLHLAFLKTKIAA